ILTNTEDNLYAMPYDLETLAENGKPVYDVVGKPVFDSAGNRIYTVTASSSSAVYDDDHNIIRYEVTDIYDLDGQPVYAGEQLYDASGQPVYDGSGQPVYVASSNIAYNTQGTKVISSTDEIQGQTAGIEYNIDYGDKAVNMPGMKLADYDTTAYYQATRTSSGGGGDIYCSSSATNYPYNLSDLGATNGTKYRYEYFPHNAGSYTTGSGLQVKRYIYKNQTFTNTRLPESKNALFINCTFNGILYVDCGKTGSTYNNVRFDDCKFKGPIITNTPNYSNSTNWWMKNCLYFTGEEDFNNVTNIPATILAPNFNVNLGNTNPDTGESNVLKGAIVGGIVDIRGNAEIYGTVISMYDTSGYSSGYVNNIGATLGDGGSETTEPGDIGIINITPNPDQLLPSGVTTPIVIKPLRNSYNESI
ncbi:MAG TPA: hypothetical protein PLP05_07215, partial [Sedimentisphaerales bacterium]|nr:hypothetical protein [Sedimentisphaerales bacterium]